MDKYNNEGIIPTYELQYNFLDKKFKLIKHKQKTTYLSYIGAYKIYGYGRSFEEAKLNCIEALSEKIRLEKRTIKELEDNSNCLLLDIATIEEEKY